MKKVLLAAAVVIVLAGIIWWGLNSGSPAAPSTTPATTTTTVSTTTEPTSAGYADGTYVGAPENAVYGTVQVSATISGGKIVNIDLLQQPDAPGHTTEVNQSALPILQQEALSIQAANVDVVSGATQTSEAFQASLASALAQA